VGFLPVGFRGRGGGGPHVAVDQVVVARVVVYVDGDVAQLRDLAAQGVQQGVVLPLALVGFGGHGFGRRRWTGGCLRRAGRGGGRCALERGDEDGRLLGVRCPGR
jgi:hypothetical protein